MHLALGKGVPPGAIPNGEAVDLVALQRPPPNVLHAQALLHRVHVQEACLHRTYVPEACVFPPILMCSC